MNKQILFKTEGVLNFFPPNKTKKHFRQAKQLQKKVCVITTPCDLHSYYRWFLIKRFSLFLLPPLRGTHIAMINDIITNDELYELVSNKYQKNKIEFFYEIEPCSNGKYWWLNVFCPQAENIREELGLSRIPYFTFHLTIGNANDNNIKHSNYILDCCKKFKLIDNTPIKKLDEYLILY